MSRPVDQVDNLLEEVSNYLKNPFNPRQEKLSGLHLLNAYPFFGDRLAPARRRSWQVLSSVGLNSRGDPAIPSLLALVRVTITLSIMFSGR
jgi:hypothetical protein